MPPRIPSRFLLQVVENPLIPPECRYARINAFCFSARISSPNLHKHTRGFSTTPIRRDAELPSDLERQRSSFAKNVSSRLDHLQAVVFTAGQRINDLTGYTGIEALKKEIDEQETKLHAMRDDIQAAKVAYKAAISRRSDSQKEVNELLQRKHAWSATDLERFTELYRSDHANEQAEIQAHNKLNEIEKAAEDTRSVLSKSILTRYHEEQVWSDKIRRASTWGTWMLTGLNVVLFIVVQLGLEPWKRRRLVNNFEEKVREMLEKEKEKIVPMVSAAIPAVEEAVDSLREGEPIGEVVEDVEKMVKEQMNDEQRDWQQVRTEAEIPSSSVNLENLGERLSVGVQSLFSDQKVSLRHVDVTTYVLQGFTVGAVAIGMTLSLLWRR